MKQCNSVLAKRLIEEALVETELQEFIPARRIRSRREEMAIRMDDGWPYYGLGLIEDEEEEERRAEARYQDACRCEGGEPGQEEIEVCLGPAEVIELGGADA